MSAPIPFSQKLLQCITKLDGENKSQAKMELVLLSSELMPNGKPNFLGVIKYPMIRDLVKTDTDKMKFLGIITLLVKDFCSSFNVVRNMNENQMIEAANMLLEECDNFRLEDYVIMFQMGKRGELFDVHDRIDLQVITAMMDKYWQLRHEAGESQIESEINHIDTLGNTQRVNAKNLVWNDNEGYIEIPTFSQQVENLSSAFNESKSKLERIIGTKEEREKLREIEKADTEAIRQRKLEKGYDD